jgi:hypothetical protein
MTRIEASCCLIEFPNISCVSPSLVHATPVCLGKMFEPLSRFFEHAAVVKDLKALSSRYENLTLPRIVVVGEPGSGVSGVVECMIGFNPKLRKSANPIEYRFKNDSACPSPICVVNDGQLEYTLPADCEALVEAIHDRAIFRDTKNVQPIILTIRSAAVPDMEFVDLSFEKRWAQKYLCG